MRLDVFVRLAFLLYYYITSIYEEMCLSVYLLYIYSIESRIFIIVLKHITRRGNLREDFSLHSGFFGFGQDPCSS